MVAGVDEDPPLQLQLVSNLADVVVGDAVVSSGTDGVYPRGFAIGTVEKSERGHGLYRAIAVRPAVDFSSIEEVLIVLVPARPAAPRAGTGRDPGRAREMKIAAVILALVVALVLQSTLAGLRIGGTTAVNLVLVVVVYGALSFGAAGGLVIGTVGGLMQDALAGGIIGIGGFAKTLVGFLVGVARGAVHRLAAAAAVRDVLRRHHPARGLHPGALRGGRIARPSGCRIRRR